MVGESIVVLDRYLETTVPDPGMRLPLTADQRCVLRGRRSTLCGCDVLLQLPRDGVLCPGDQLSDATSSVVVEVVAASESLLKVCASSPLDLLQAAYHLGNRHVALELHQHHLFMLADSVLETMLRGRGLSITPCDQPFHPEGGAYMGHYHP